MARKNRHPWLPVLFFTLLAAFLLSAGCSRTDGKGPEKDKLDVIATIFPPFDFARQAGGEQVEVSMLLPPGSESHTYEPSPRDVIRIKDCDLFIYNGGPSDAWVDRLLEAAEIEPARTVRMMDYVTLIEESDQGVLEGEAEQETGPHIHHYDEHIWTDPMNALRIAEGIAKSLGAIDPVHAADYRTNVSRFGDELRALDHTFREIVQAGPRREIIVADRFPLIYFTTAYDLGYMAAFPGCAAETDPKPRTVSAIIEKVRREQIPFIFHMEFSDQKLADLVVSETGAQKLLFHAAHNVSREEIEQGVTYLSLMKENAENLRRGLAK
ncbi:MAG TPA: metal ABC transporter substrate-binding protein [Bacillota bacterium]|nr:zinc ABC transporter substrate-binding protein [Fastidiosipila sp.]HPX93383.1 metal ABC transporter substrate-binding protein [Bacillota bacterium]HQB80479.1 metal ABC transporter substrate-binding protein [Bacillota bacterium]